MLFSSQKQKTDGWELWMLPLAWGEQHTLVRTKTTWTYLNIKVRAIHKRKKLWLDAEAQVSKLVSR